MIAFEESGMVFSFDEQRLFYIEKSELYSKVLNAKGISVVECVISRPINNAEAAILIEAKQSAPNPEGQGGKARFQEFIQEISHKFIHSVSICYAILHHVQIVEESKYPMGEMITEHLRDTPNIIFLLIVKQHTKEWCIPLQEALNQKLKRMQTIWHTQVLVLNEEMARAKHFIQ